MSETGNIHEILNRRKLSLFKSLFLGRLLCRNLLLNLYFCLGPPTLFLLVRYSIELPWAFLASFEDFDSPNEARPLDLCHALHIHFVVGAVDEVFNIAVREGSIVFFRMVMNFVTLYKITCF